MCLDTGPDPGPYCSVRQASSSGACTCSSSPLQGQAYHRQKRACLALPWQPCQDLCLQPGPSILADLELTSLSSACIRQGTAGSYTSLPHPVTRSQVRANVVVGLVERLRVRLVLLKRREPYSEEAATEVSRYLKAQARAQNIREGQDLTPRRQSPEPMLPIDAR